MGKKPTIDFVAQKFEEGGYKLLTRVYKNCEQKLEYICSVGHKHSTSWHDWKRNRRCRHCAILRRADKRRLNIDDIRDSFGSENYILLAKDYTLDNIKLKYRCPAKHIHSITWNNWRKGSRCPSCFNATRGKSLRLDLAYVKESFEEENYILINDEYENSHKKLDYICPENHRNTTTWNIWQVGHRCPTCANLRKGLTTSGPDHYNWRGGIARKPYCADWTKEYRNYIKERDGYTCLNPECSKEFSDLHVHHIDYNKESCGRFNLITLCVSCNSKANYNREWHKAWYQAIICRRYKEVTR